MWQQLNVEIYWTSQKRTAGHAVPRWKHKSIQQFFFFSISDSCFINEKTRFAPSSTGETSFCGLHFVTDNCLHAMPFSCPALLPANHSVLHPEAPEKGQVNYFCHSKMGCFSFSILVLCVAAPSQRHWNTAEPSWMSVTASFPAVTRQNICYENI